MATSAAHKRALRVRRHARVRKHITGTPERPRLAVFRSARHVTAQVIDDTTGRTLASASSIEKAARTAEATLVSGGGNVAAARVIGRLVAERAKVAGVDKVVFDRGGYLYHGRVAAVADAAREAGLEF